MSVLIVTEPDDIHAVLVKLALAQKNVKCELFFTADMPSIQKNNIYISSNSCSWQTNRGDDNNIAGDEFDVIWWRRPRKPYLPKDIHKDDIDFIKRENLSYHNSIPFLLNDKAWWVNPIASQYKTSSKIVQLNIAQQCGFLLPETLISNSPQDVKAFIKSSKYESVIYKPFSPQFWLESEGMKLLYTNKISLDDLPSDKMLQVVPGIYQKYIEKQYEVRVTCFGSHISAVKIDSQSHLLGQVDWRKIPGQELTLSEISLPYRIKEKIRRFMKKTGVVFGCFDFIVTPQNDFVFLELNEQGQFLWIEENQSQLHYLDMFTNFLINKHFDFSWKKTTQTLCASNFDKEALDIVENNVAKHVYLNKIDRAA